MVRLALAALAENVADGSMMTGEAAAVRCWQFYAGGDECVMFGWLVFG